MQKLEDLLRSVADYIDDHYVQICESVAYYEMVESRRIAPFLRFYSKDTER